jgi:hypothetical protein
MWKVWLIWLPKDASWLSSWMDPSDSGVIGCSTTGIWYVSGGILHSVVLGGERSESVLFSCSSSSKSVNDCTIEVSSESLFVSVSQFMLIL